MKALDLNRLNVKAPYSVWEAGKQSYGFKTDFGVLFRIVFIDDQTIWDNGSYEFAILNENNKPSPNDGKVKNTFYRISTTLSDFSKSSLNDSSHFDR